MLSINHSGKRYLLELAYNGYAYHGWQIQPNAWTVQAELKKAFSLLLNEEVNIVGAGRTDTGVHASHFVAHFDFLGDDIDCPDLKFKLNRFLKKDIRIDRLQPVSDDFHARFSALSRTYHYLISREKQPFINNLTWLYDGSLDGDTMNEAARILMKYDDFTSFARLHSDSKTNICSIQNAEWQCTDILCVFKIQADRFLRNMVRAIVGTMVEVGKGKMTVDDFEAVILAKNRSSAAQSAPPEGLFLTEVNYPEEIFEINPIKPFSWFF
ncbi:MAG: tRNA pseudouridine(38-40) synthase TruA [Bacteroidales bacterium]|nr:tRNA pseudouridine(38-40) synthase TruA [Bacteroidales bacterium]